MRLSKPHVLLIAAIATLIFATIACGGSVTSIPSANGFSTIAAQTLQAVTPLASPTLSLSTLTSAPLPTSTASLSTATSAPPTSTQAVSNLPAATRISFATGATYSVTQGTVQAGQAVFYTAQAAKGQPMIVMLNTPDQSAILSVFGADGTVLLSRSEQSTSWQGTLPSTQDYYFRVTGGASTQNFTLTVNIPARIQFASEQTEVALSGQTVGGYGVAYVAYAFKGQQMQITINTAPEVAGLTVWGFSDGQPYARAQNGVTNFDMTLPATQDYIIEIVPAGGSVVNYQVTVKIQ